MLLKMASQRLTTTVKSLIPINHHHPLLIHLHHHNQITSQFSNFSSPLIPINLHLLHRYLHLRPPPLSMSSQASPVPPPDSSTPIKTVKVVIKGRVQGVFYRDWTVENATELGLKGWVRNRRDGSVEALFSGSPDKVGEMQERCRRGPPSAMVTGLNVSPSAEDPGSRFERLPTV